MKLRKEAIENIENVFNMSVGTLVCDRDVMSIDISSADLQKQLTDESTVKSCEQTLTVMLVCDWNVRAWTFLEAFKGWNNIHILCKNSMVVSVMRFGFTFSFPLSQR